MFTFVLALLALGAQHVSAVDTVVDLGYAKYRGINSGSANAVIQWAGMRYARSTSRVDGLRFTAPQDPLQEKAEIIDASQFGPVCIGTAFNLVNEFGDKESEDCLFINVFAPTKATNTSKLPVYVFIQGGGFVLNGNANYNATQMIEAAEDDLVVVNFNYRVGPYGFLASNEIAADKSLSLNNGLKDQRQALKWVQQHISQFGGDPNHVTLGGASAGGGSTVLQLTAYGGRNDNLFHAAAVESAAFPPMRNVSESQFQYNLLLQKSGCADLNCLRGLDAVRFQAAVRSIKGPFPGAEAAPIFFWNPTLDYDFVKDYTYSEIEKGNFVKVPTIFGDDTNEGITFTPNSINSLAAANNFVLNQFTSYTDADQKSIMKIWGGGPKNTRDDTEWRSVASDIYGHIRYICGGLNISAAYSTNGDGAPTYQYRWNVGAATHVAEIGSIWNNGTNAAAVFVQGYFVSFFRSYDPNRYKRTFFNGLDGGKQLTSPDWVTFGSNGGSKRMLFDDNNDVHIEDVSKDQKDKCSVISNSGLQLDQIVGKGSTGSASGGNNQGSGNNDDGEGGIGEHKSAATHASGGPSAAMYLAYAVTISYAILSIVV